MRGDRGRRGERGDRGGRGERGGRGDKGDRGFGDRGRGGRGGSEYDREARPQAQKGSLASLSDPEQKLGLILSIMSDHIKQQLEKKQLKDEYTFPQNQLF